MVLWLLWCMALAVHSTTHKDKRRKRQDRGPLQSKSYAYLHGPLLKGRALSASQKPLVVIDRRCLVRKNEIKH